NDLVVKGNTVVVIEHNIDVIKSADHIIDLGPEGGHNGGKIVAIGTPEEVAEVPVSYTGKFLKPKLSVNVSSKIFSIERGFDKEIPKKKVNADIDSLAVSFPGVSLEEN
ncbi:MAG: hypothetical protein MUO26_02590, partial [Methanotrichaceae archaeon]|nr:hypothetical protein [Methanotrichaceae archaeon]